MENKHNPNAREITDWIGNSRITWCGPFSVATVAGIKYEPAYQTLKMIRGKRHCKGVTNSNIAKACKQLVRDLALTLNTPLLKSEEFFVNLSRMVILSLVKFILLKLLSMCLLLILVIGRLLTIRLLSGERWMLLTTGQGNL